ncbi:MAG: cellobiose phosphorylase [Haloplasmataceae bacterium]|nr:cellobiose phosphorylase [Haloplasmataceae bacterium]
MIVNNDIKKTSLSTGDVFINILESGTITDIRKGYTQINLLSGNNIEGSSSNIYLRVYENHIIHYTKMIGVDSPSKFYIENNQAFYRGTFLSVDYQVILTVKQNIWFWEVTLNSNENKIVDVIYGQDVAINDLGAVKNNEAYTCQYIDHKIFINETGYTVCSRQNQGTPHFLQQGSLTKNIAYSTDGFQFYGLDYKVTNTPIGLISESLENRNYQYEFAYTALQSEKVVLSGSAQFVFYGIYEDNIYEVATEPRFLDQIKSSYSEVKKNQVLDETKLTKLERKLTFNDLVHALEFTNSEIELMYPNRKHVEKENDTLLSFFNDDSSHVVLKAKETLVERPHGHILITGNNLLIKNDIIASTNFMFGVFNSHIVVGNSNFHKFTTNIRNPLNVARISGQRILVEIDGVYQLLGVPSIYELGVNYTKWIYKLSNDIITITSSVLVDSPQLILDIQSLNGIKYNYIVTNHIVLGPNEYEYPFEVNIKENVLEFIPHQKSMANGKNPNLRYNLVVLASDFEVNKDNLFYNDHESRNEPFITLTIKASVAFRIITQGRPNGEQFEIKNYDLESVKQDYLAYFRNILNNFKLSIDNETSAEVDKFNDIALWYTHNALVHYSSPHGLEQYSGAAWGTRDVCQGPFEYFLATQKFEVLKDIILKVYSHQFLQTGDFPQWFMYDEYFKIQAHESHGDIILWPLRTIAIYILTTGDVSILMERVRYTDLSLSDYTKETYSIIDHALLQIKSIKANFIEGTHLSTYGGGDWDDTLQPANKELTKSMVSGWTVALTYEVLTQFSDALLGYNKDLGAELRNLAEAIKKDYIDYVVIDNVPAGFLLFKDELVIPLLHPNDTESGLHYRLLPFNQGIIGEIFNKSQIKAYLEIIIKNLKHPDGVRLMDNTVKYKGGINKYFTRAETALISKILYQMH